MKFKRLKEPIFTSELYYDLFDGGYFDPSKLLKDQADIEKVNAAIATVQEYLMEAQDAGVIEVG